MKANITLTEIMTNSFVTGVQNVVNSASIKHFFNHGELDSLFAVKVK